MWVYLLILLGSWLYRWYERRKNFFVVTDNNYRVHNWISNLLICHQVNGSIRYFGVMFEPMESIELCVDPVRFKVRLLERNEINEDEMGELTERIGTGDYDNRFEVRDKTFYRIDILSEPISYTDFHDIFESDYSRRWSYTGQPMVGIDRLEYSRSRYNLRTSHVKLRSASDRTFFSFHRKLIMVTSHQQPMLFHGPSGNGKSSAIIWLARQLDIPIHILSFSTAAASNKSLWDYLCGFISSPRVLVIPSIETIIRNPKWLDLLYRFLELIRLNPKIVLIATTQDLSTLNGTKLITSSRFKSIVFDYPNSQVMNQITQHYYQRDYTGEIPKLIPIDTIMEYARTKSYEEFSTMF